MADESRKLAFANLMNRACAAYQRREIAPATLEVYYDALVHVPMDVLAERLNNHVANSPKFPTIADLKPPPRSHHGYGPALPRRYQEDLIKVLINGQIVGLILREGGLTPEKLRELVDLRDVLATEYTEDDDGYSDYCLTQLEEQLAL